MKKLILTFFASAGIIALSYGQYVDQALIFSQQNYGSTARSKAMGNAFGAIGGDFSSLSINPAGIGIYLKPELSGTFNILGINSIDSHSYIEESNNRISQGKITDNINDDFSFRNFGIVFTNPVQNGNSGLVSFNFGFGFNRLNNFNQSLSGGIDGLSQSRMDEYVNITNGINSRNLRNENDPYNNVPWESKLAWENYLINVANPDGEGMGNDYQSILFPNELVNENMTINSDGYNNEWIASFGANINHQLYLGATIGFQDLHHNIKSNYNENGEFGYFNYTNVTNTKGKGYNVKLGVIYKPIPALRLGAAIHTPTYFYFKESYYWTMSSKLKDVSSDANGSHYAETPITDYEYNMDTPMRAIGSIAYQFGKKGIIAVDYEYVNYSKIKLKSYDDYKYGDDQDVVNDNNEISSIYQSVSNLRIGGEFKPTNAVSLRAGYELLGNPFNSNAYNVSQPNKDFKYNTLNGGIGYRIENVSLDISYSLSNRTQYSYQNLDALTDVLVKNHNSRSELVFTLGIKL